MLRTTPFFALSFLFLSACTFLDEPPFGSRSNEPSILPATGPAPVTQPINVCAASSGACADYATSLPKLARPRPNAAVAYVSADEETDLALYADGTLLAKVTARSRGYSDWYWDLGDVRAKVSAATTRDLLARLEQMKGMDLARPFFGAGRGIPSAADRFVLDGGAEACTSHPVALSTPFFCQAPQPLELLRWELEVLGGAARQKWLDATEGTIALMGEVHPAPWPLDAALASAGTHAITEADYAALDGNDTWSLPDGRLVLAGRWKVVFGSARTDYEVEVSAVEAPAIVPDEPATLRADLLATNGKLAWSSAWLGIDADSTVFPAFKGKRVALFPKTDSDTMHVYRLAAFEHRDLTNDGDL